MKQGTVNGINPEQIAQIVEDFDTYAQSAKEANSEATEILKDAKEKYGAHVQALRLAARVKRMPEEKKHAFLDAFDQARLALKLDERAQIAMDFDGSQETRAN